MSRYVRVAGDMITRRALARRLRARAPASFQCWTIVPGSSCVCAISSQPTGCLPWRAHGVARGSTNATYSSCRVACASSPPMWRYAPGVSAATSREHVVDELGTRALGDVERAEADVGARYGSGSTPAARARDTRRSAAFTCPGRSISGTTTTPRSAACSTISRVVVLRVEAARRRRRRRSRRRPPRAAATTRSRSASPGRR